MNLSEFKFPRPVIIEDIEDNAKNIKTLKLKNYIDDCKFENVSPGKFCNIWIPKLDMKPLSISNFENNILSFTFKKVGKVTSYMYNKLKIGERLGLIGPLGNGFTIKGKKILLIGGGIGLAPLRYLLKELALKKLNITSLLGFKTENETIFIEDFQNHSKKFYITTENGCMGEKGYSTDLLSQVCEENKIDQIYCCGPELMMFEVLNFSLKNNINFQFSLERYIGCGLGLCGFCSLNGKFRVCKDGHVISSLELKELTDFGNNKLTKTGLKVKI